MRGVSRGLSTASLLRWSHCRHRSSSSSPSPPPCSSSSSPSPPPSSASSPPSPSASSTVSDAQLASLASKHQHHLTLADLVRYGRPPLSQSSLLASANFALSLLPIRLARRIQALRNLPYIVVSNANISRIYDNYLHSLSILLPYCRAAATHRRPAIASLDDEVAFTEVLAELVATHTDTIPVLAKGFLECRRYIAAPQVTQFLDHHLRARIGTRLIAEQHIALHYSSQPLDTASGASHVKPDPCYVGVIDSALRPAATIDSCAGFVADICELRYGSRPRLLVDGEPDATFAFVPMHLEYIVTELLKNAFRATLESRSNEPIVVTIAPERPLNHHHLRLLPDALSTSSGSLQDNAPGVTIRIRDRGGGIPPDILPHIWSYSFTTFTQDDSLSFPSASASASIDGLGVISSAGAGGSSIAGLGYGLPLSRAYAEYFGGGITVQTLYGWGTDVYLRLKGVGTIAA
ncbi:hypothetical protein CDD81_7316 [Ophiocordyceps australis]|uniref:Protein-serine/threonine kinase n=1 Tax=Ophiocordyceps australis TaxID=1399860 RepID=A0A2C5Y3J8_9HYPO|nr:hypothetical protein CDD81_7316 [Ophiocordyceps australis]